MLFVQSPSGIKVFWENVMFCLDMHYISLLDPSKWIVTRMYFHLCSLNTYSRAMHSANKSLPPVAFTLTIQSVLLLLCVEKEVDFVSSIHLTQHGMYCTDDTNPLMQQFLKFFCREKIWPAFTIYLTLLSPTQLPCSYLPNVLSTGLWGLK